MYYIYIPLLTIFLLFVPNGHDCFASSTIPIMTSVPVSKQIQSPHKYDPEGSNLLADTVYLSRFNLGALYGSLSRIQIVKVNCFHSKLFKGIHSASHPGCSLSSKLLFRTSYQCLALVVHKPKFLNNQLLNMLTLRKVLELSELGGDSPPNSTLST